jgi:ferredoxin
MNTLPRIDLLTALPALKGILKSRVFQPMLMLGTLLIFVLVILTGLFGTTAGSRSFAIIFVWIVWWAFLILMMVPFFGRLWCTVCPIPALGEWMQRGSIINKKSGDLHTLNWRWSGRLKNMWLQNFGFLGIALFSAVILTRPHITAWVPLSFILISVILSALYKNRMFCRYVCPVGGFIGPYSMLAPLELRVRDPNICLDHKTKDCITGNESGYGCPWEVYPGNLTRNVYCGTCMECLKTCPQNNIVLNLRVPGNDLLVAKERRLDESGTYTFYCTSWCSLDHWRMRGVIDIHDPQNVLSAFEPDPVIQALVEEGVDIDASLHLEEPEPFILTAPPSAVRGRLLTEQLMIPSELWDANWRMRHRPLDVVNLLAEANPLARQNDLVDIVSYLLTLSLDAPFLPRAADLYNQNCSSCHRQDGNGDGFASAYTTEMPAAFANPEYMFTMRSDVLYVKIRRGGMGTDMPNFGTVFTPDETWALVNYLWTFILQDEANGAGSEP